MFKKKIEDHDDHEEPVEEEKSVVEEQKDQAATEKELDEKWAKEREGKSDPEEESEDETSSEKRTAADTSDHIDDGGVESNASRLDTGSTSSADKGDTGDTQASPEAEEAAEGTDKDEKITDASLAMMDKQKGMSQGPTQHSSKPHGNKDKSQKTEGFAETTKLQGTVSRDRELK